MSSTTIQLSSHKKKKTTFYVFIWLKKAGYTTYTGCYIFTTSKLILPDTVIYNTTSDKKATI